MFYLLCCALFGVSPSFRGSFWLYISRHCRGGLHTHHSWFRELRKFGLLPGDLLAWVNWLAGNSRDWLPFETTLIRCSDYWGMIISGYVIVALTTAVCGRTYCPWTTWGVTLLPLFLLSLPHSSLPPSL